MAEEIEYKSLRHTGEQIDDAVDGLNAHVADTTRHITSSERNAWNNKVDKVPGKQLSTEDYTTAEKAKLAGLTNYDDTEVKTDISAIQTKDTAQDTTIAKIVDAGAKNLLKNTGTSQTIRNVTFTVNDDGTVTVDGTNNTSSTAVFYLNILPADTAPNYNGCRLTGCPQGGSTSTYRLAVQLNSGAYTNYASDTGGGSTIHDVPSSDCRVVIAVYPGATVNNLTFKPMICTADDYAASPVYAPYTPKLQELYEEVEDIENAMRVTMVDTAAFSSLAGYIDTLGNGAFSLLVPNNNALTDVPMNNASAIVRAVVYSAATAMMEFCPISSTYNGQFFTQIKSGGTWRGWYKFEGAEVT